jgi:hypothetical protein
LTPGWCCSTIRPKRQTATCDVSVRTSRRGGTSRRAWGAGCLA